MTAELTALTLAALLQVCQFCLMALCANLELGTGKTLSPRDGAPLIDQVTVRTARQIRAMNNHFEALAFFTIAVVVVTLSNQSTPFTATCAWVYLAARVLYVPAYAFGWVPWRSVVWTIAMAASTAMLISVVL